MFLDVNAKIRYLRFSFYKLLTWSKKHFLLILFAIFSVRGCKMTRICRHWTLFCRILFWFFESFFFFFFENARILRIRTAYLDWAGCVLFNSFLLHSIARNWTWMIRKLIYWLLSHRNFLPINLVLLVLKNFRSVIGLFLWWYHLT